MKIRKQSTLLGFFSLLTVGAIGFLILIQLQSSTALSRKMQKHQQALVQLNSYQVTAITQILYSVDLIRTGDISGERIIKYRMSETHLSREVENLEKLIPAVPSLSEEFLTLQREGTALSELCRRELMEPLYSHVPLRQGIIERLIYTELAGLNTRMNGIEKNLNDIISDDLSRQIDQERLLNRICLPSAAALLLLYFLASHLILLRSLKYINRTRHFLGDLADGSGSLDVFMAERGNDEITHLRKNFNLFMGNLNKRHQSLKRIASDQVNMGERLNQLALEHAAASQQLQRNLSAVNGRSEEITGQVDSSLGEMREIVRAMENLEDHTGSLEEGITRMMRQGEKIRESLVSQETAVTQQVSLTIKVKEESLNSKRILDLLKEQIEEIILQSTSIAGAILSIEDLADKTDILAINASIEAARSGYQGRGFAVVAKEMGSLSVKVRKNVLTISSLLGSLNEKLTLMAEEESENQLSLEKLIEENMRAESAVEALQSTNGRIGKAVADFFTLVDSVRREASAVHRETESAKGRSREITFLMDSINGSQKRVREETEEMLHGVNQLLQGSRAMEKLSEENIETAGDLDREIKKLGS